MSKFIDHHIPEKNGKIKHINGEVLGAHNGIQHFTVGQRKGIGISWKEPLYVKKLDYTNNVVYVASIKDLFERKAIIKDLNWVSIKEPNEEIEVSAQIRYRSKPVKGRLIPIKNDNIITNFELIFNDDQSSITPGQAAVFYQDEILLGGGIIT